MDQRTPDDTGEKYSPATSTAKIGFAQAVTLYGDHWRAGLSVLYNLSGRHTAAHGMRHKSQSENNIQQDTIIMRYRALRDMTLAIDASEADTKKTSNS